MRSTRIQRTFIAFTIIYTVHFRIIGIVRNQLNIFVVKIVFEAAKLRFCVIIIEQLLSVFLLICLQLPINLIGLSMFS